MVLNPFRNLSIFPQRNRIALDMALEILAPLSQSRDCFYSSLCTATPYPFPEGVASKAVYLFNMIVMI